MALIFRKHLGILIFSKSESLPAFLWNFCQVEILPAEWLEKGSCTTYAASFLLFEEAVLIPTEGSQIPLIQKNSRGNNPCKSPEGEPLNPMESYFPHLKRVAAKPSQKLARVLFKAFKSLAKKQCFVEICKLESEIFPETKYLKQLDCRNKSFPILILSPSKNAKNDSAPNNKSTL
ncbi:hypothetical protein TNCV_1507491 [Trichonephila clavipes]|nr:hypothetical protein TNCV_1507491 [Trichonephila clavipes]